MSVRFAIALAVIAASALTQTTQGIISGRVFNADTGAPLANARVRYTNAATLSTGSVRADPHGNYTLPLLSPGTYSVRAELEAAEVQSGEVHNIMLTVASRLRLDYALRPLANVWETGQTKIIVLPATREILPFFGPDVETGRTAASVPEKPDISTMQPSLSYVIEPQSLAHLPLPSRDVYTLLVTLPGVTTETATGRGLGLSVNGQRPSSTNFLLDGVENNDYLLTGPYTTIAPEATEEYRISVNNFSADYGGTSGVIANAATRQGSSDLHGVAYGYLNNDALNANSFQNNANHRDRLPRKELFAGFWAGGPIKHDRAFFSSALERLRSRARAAPRTAVIPLLERFREFYPSGPGRQILEKYPPPVVEPPLEGQPNFTLAGTMSVSDPITLDRWLLLERVDYVSRDSEQRLFSRVLISRASQPDFVPSLYTGFNSELRTNSIGATANYTRHFSAAVTSEFRVGYRQGEIGYDRPHPEVPVLLASTITFGDVELPGSLLPSEFRNRDRNWEFGTTTVRSKSNHVFTLGGGLLRRRAEPLLAYRRDGQFRFADMLGFAQGRPTLFTVTVARPELESLPDARRYDRRRLNTTFNLFVHDVWHPSSALSLTFGLRYDSFGALSNRGVGDAYFIPGQGSSLVQLVEGGAVGFGGESSEQPYRPDRNDIGVRFGAAYKPAAATVLRTGFGIFYDRLFDNLTLATILNGVQDKSHTLTQPLTSYEQPFPSVLAIAIPSQNPGGAPMLWMDANLRTPAVRSWFVSVQHQPVRSTSIELSYRGALSNNLITTDSVNRFSHDKSQALNPNFARIRFRSNEGSLNYHALGALLRYRAPRGHMQASYTFGHTVDIQSEPLLGEFTDIAYARGALQRPGFASFTQLGMPGLDRGNSDYDQRHNFFVFSLWQAPTFGKSWLRWLTRDWQVGQLAAIRSGFPYTVVGCVAPCPPPNEGIEFERNRADLVGGVDVYAAERRGVVGGVQLLNPAAFANPAPGRLGNLGRNSLAGPGFWNIDGTIARAFRVPRAPESVRLQFRADFFNLFNHANLGNPISVRNDPAFGQALYGRTAVESPLRIVPPADELPRRIQLQIKLWF